MDQLLIAFLAACSLAVANVCSVIMVQAEARGRPVVAGLAEVAYWGANILTIKFAVTHFTVWLTLFCLVSAYLSTYFATKHGHESIEDPIDLRQDGDLAELEARVEVLESDQ